MPKKPPYIPPYLRGVKPPKAAVDAASCDLCGALLCVTDSGNLACGRALHGKLKPVAGVALEVEHAWPLLAKRQLSDPAAVIRRLFRNVEAYGADTGS